MNEMQVFSNKGKKVLDIAGLMYFIMFQGMATTINAVSLVLCESTPSGRHMLYLVYDAYGEALINPQWSMLVYGGLFYRIHNKAMGVDMTRNEMELIGAVCQRAKAAGLNLQRDSGALRPAGDGAQGLFCSEVCDIEI